MRLLTVLLVSLLATGAAAQSIDLGEDRAATTPGRQAIVAQRHMVAAAHPLAAEAGLDVRFEAADATSYAIESDEPPHVVVVNPPRRGIGAELSAWLERSGVERVVYSSCNAVSLARDLALMPSLRPVEARVLDMFPHTTHYEVIALLERGR